MSNFITEFLVILFLRTSFAQVANLAASCGFCNSYVVFAMAVIFLATAIFVKYIRLYGMVKLGILFVMVPDERQIMINKAKDFINNAKLKLNRG